MEISKFIVGVITIAIGLWSSGRLVPSVLKLSNAAVASQKDQQNFSIANWNRIISKKAVLKTKSH